MRDLDTTDAWTADDDAFLRGALLSLRADVDASPLTDPGGARSRGDFTHRRRMVALTAGVAAAVTIVAALGFRGIADEDALPPPLPGTPTPTLAPTQTPTTPTSTTSAKVTASPSSTASATSSPSRTSATSSPRTSPTGTGRVPAATGTGPTNTGGPRPSGSPSPHSTPISAYPPVYGADGGQKPDRRLFVPLAGWQSAVYGTSLSVNSVVGDYFGQSDVLTCDVDTSGKGAFGIAIYTNEATSGQVGIERIRQHSSAAALQDQLTSLRGTIAAGCTEGTATTAATAGPTADTWKVTTTFDGGSFDEWVALVDLGDNRLATLAIGDLRSRTDAQGFQAIAALKAAASGN